MLSSKGLALAVASIAIAFVLAIELWASSMQTLPKPPYYSTTTTPSYYSSTSSKSSPTLTTVAKGVSASPTAAKSGAEHASNPARKPGARAPPPAREHREAKPHRHGPPPPHPPKPEVDAAIKELNDAYRALSTLLRRVDASKLPREVSDLIKTAVNMYREGIELFKEGKYDLARAYAHIAKDIAAEVSKLLAKPHPHPLPPPPPPKP